MRVTLFLEQDYLRTSLKRDKTTHVPIAPVPKPGETPEQALERVQWRADDTDLSENRRILAALLRSDVEVRGDFNPEIFHQKFILRDYDDGKATSPATRPSVRLGELHLDGHSRESQQRVRVPQLATSPASTSSSSNSSNAAGSAGHSTATCRDL